MKEEIELLGEYSDFVTYEKDKETNTIKVFVNNGEDVRWFIKKLRVNGIPEITSDKPPSSFR